MTDGITWLAAPEAIAFGGYCVLLARGLDEGELVDRITENVFCPPRRARALGELTGGELLGVLDGEFTRHATPIGLRHGRAGDTAYAVAYGAWQAETGDRRPVSRGGAHVFRLEYEEANGKPVPPQFRYLHDERLMCAFNLHLDGSWGYTGVQGEPDLAARVQAALAAAGLPDDDLPDRDVHRAALGVLQDCFGLSLPRRRIVEGRLPAVLLEGV